MRSILLLLSILFLFSSDPSFGQNPEREYLGYVDSGEQLEILVSDGKYLFKPFNEKILQTSFIPTGEAYDPHSHAVVLTPTIPETRISENKKSVEWHTGGIAVIIQKKPFNVSYYYNGRLIIAEKSGYIKSDTTEQLEFELRPDEALYGGGARVLGMNRRGNLLRLYNKAHYGYETHSALMNYTMPLVLSSQMYAIHFDNAPIGYLDLDSKGDNTLRYETIIGRKTYQLVCGDNWAEIMYQYTLLTGRQPMPPRWALGNFSSRFGYHSEKETRETVDLFLKDSIPLDAVVIDIYWFGADIKGHMGNLEFLSDSFPTPVEMMADFKAKGVKTILVTEPFILTTSTRWKEATDKKLLGTDSLGNPYTYDFYFGNTGLIDLYKPEASSWFWNIYKELTERGVDGWWGDLGEPEVHPSDLQHATGSADEVHNIYGHDWAGLIYKGYQRDFPERRPFILMRAGYSGSQRYGMIPWSGDVLRSWGGLTPQTEIALQMGMQGLAYMHSDLGGFGEGKVFDPQLYSRWLQYGVFQPIFRPHAQEHIPAEPVFHEARTREAARKAIRLRYSMLPYNYSLSFENSQTGMPMMRPILFEEPDNKNTYGMAECYLWGPNLLVSPVTDSLATAQKVYFPAGSNWFGFYTGKKYSGGRSINVSLEQDHIPVFVRGGAFIPMVEPVQSTDFYSTKALSIHYYYDAKAESTAFTMYDDDGITPNAYEKGEYEILEMTATSKRGLLNILLSSEPGKFYEALNREIELVVHQLESEPENISLQGRQLPFSWDNNNKTLTVLLPLKGNDSTSIELSW